MYLATRLCVCACVCSAHSWQREFCSCRYGRLVEQKVICEMESAKWHYLTYLSTSASVLVCVCVCVHDALFKLMTYAPHLSLYFTAVSFVIERLWWVSSNKENNQCGPTTTPPPFSLFLWHRMLWIQHQTGVKGHSGYISSLKTIFLDRTACAHTTIRAYRNQILTTTYG